MRAFLMGAVLAVAAFTVSTQAVQAYEPHHHYWYYGRPPVVVLRPAPVFITPAPVVVSPAPVVVAQPTYVVPANPPATVIVQPAFRPILSLRIGR
jgi:hypothetical protein